MTGVARLKKMIIEEDAFANRSVNNGKKHFPDYRLCPS
jgi:hypothetical protein